jgi:hypothetical protein
MGRERHPGKCPLWRAPGEFYWPREPNWSARRDSVEPRRVGISKNIATDKEKSQMRKNSRKETTRQEHPIMRGSWRSHRSATSSPGSALRAVFATFGAGAVLRQLTSELAHGRSLGEIQANARNGNLGVVSSSNATTCTAQEKRLAPTLTSLREMLTGNEIERAGSYPAQQIWQGV